MIETAIEIHKAVYMLNFPSQEVSTWGINFALTFLGVDDLEDPNSASPMAKTLSWVAAMLSIASNWATKRVWLALLTYQQTNARSHGV